MAFMVLVASGSAFIASIPKVTNENQCLEESKGHPLLCYTDYGVYPEDCATLTEKQNGSNIRYTCYAWSLQAFRVAAGAAIVIFKTVVISTTFYVRFSEYIWKMLQESIQMVLHGCFMYLWICQFCWLSLQLQ